MKIAAYVLALCVLYGILGNEDYADEQTTQLAVADYVKNYQNNDIWLAKND